MMRERRNKIQVKKKINLGHALQLEGKIRKSYI